MKINRILSLNLGGAQDMRPTFKPFGDLFQGISAGVNGGISNILGYFQNQENNEDSWDALKFQTGAQMQENQYARQWQSQMYDRQRDDWYKQQDYMQKLWKMQTDYTDSYNTPAKQVSRLLAAGVNPAAVFGQTGSVGNSNPSQMATSPNPSVPSASGGSIGSNLPDFQRTSMSPADIFATMAKGMESLAVAKKAGVETTGLERAMDLQIQKLSAQVETQKLGNQLQQMQNDLFAQVKDEKVKQEGIRTLQGIANHILTMAETKNYEADTIVKQYDALYTQLKSMGVQLQNWWTPKMFRAQIDDLYADVKLKQDEAKFVQQRERSARLDNDIEQIRHDLITADYETRQEYISAFRGLLKQQYNYGEISYEQYRASEHQADILESQARMAQTDADYYGYEKAVNLAVGTIKNILGIRNDVVRADAYNRYTAGYENWVNSYDQSHNQMYEHSFTEKYQDSRGHIITNKQKGKKPKKK